MMTWPVVARNRLTSVKDAQRRRFCLIHTPSLLHCKVGWQDVSVVACETLGADSFSQSFHAGKLVTLPAITSLATTLGAKVSGTPGSALEQKGQKAFKMKRLGGRKHVSH